MHIKTIESKWERATDHEISLEDVDDWRQKVNKENDLNKYKKGRRWTLTSVATNYWNVCIDHLLIRNELLLVTVMQIAAILVFIDILVLRLQFRPAVLLNIQEQPCTWGSLLLGDSLADIWYIWSDLRQLCCLGISQASPEINNITSSHWQYLFVYLASISCTNHWASMYYTDRDFTN